MYVHTDEKENKSYFAINRDVPDSAGGLLYGQTLYLNQLCLIFNNFCLPVSNISFCHRCSPPPPTKVYRGLHGPHVSYSRCV